MTTSNEYLTEVEYVPRLIASACGLDGAGKTRFACTMPGHIAYLSIDPNTRESLTKTQAELGTSVELHEFAMPGVAFGGRDDVQDLANDAFDRVIDVLAPLVRRERKRNHPDCIVLDTATEFYALKLLADHGKLIEIPQWGRSKSNGAWKSVLRGLKDSGCHVLLLHRLRPRYESRTVHTKKGPSEERVQVPGEYDRDGFSGTGFQINAEVHLLFDPARRDEPTEPIDDCFGMKVTRCTGRPALVGREVWGTTSKGVSRVTFPRLVKMIYPEA